MFILASTVTGWVSISAFASLVDIPAGITIYGIGIKIWAMIAGIKNYKQIIRKIKKHDKMMLLGKYKLNTIEVFNRFRS